MTNIFNMAKKNLNYLKGRYKVNFTEKLQSLELKTYKSQFHGKP